MILGAKEFVRLTPSNDDKSKSTEILPFQAGSDYSYLLKSGVTFIIIDRKKKINKNLSLSRFFSFCTKIFWKRCVDLLYKKRAKNMFTSAFLCVKMYLVGIVISHDIHVNSIKSPSVFVFFDRPEPRRSEI